MKEVPESVIEIYAGIITDTNILPTNFKPKTNGKLNLTFAVLSGTPALKLVLNDGNGIFYQNAESITVTGLESASTNAVAAAVANATTGLEDVLITSGTGYIDGEEVSFLGGTSGATGGRGFAIVTGPNLTSVDVITSSAIPIIDISDFAVGLHTITIPVSVGSEYNFQFDAATLSLFAVTFTK